MKYVIFTDLDGTLLDRSTFTYGDAKEAIDLAKEKDVPIIFCTAKTKEQTEYYRKKLQIKDPFIVENGGALYIPLKYFSFRFRHSKKVTGYYVIMFEKQYKKMQKFMRDLKKEYQIETFDDMSPYQISKKAKIPLSQAKLAKKRTYDIPFSVKEKDKDEVFRLIRKKKYKVTKVGKFYHMMGKNDIKGAIKAIKALIKRKERTIIKIIGIGDSENDFEMLKSVNFPFLVQRKNSSYASNDFNKVKGKGPVGWNNVVKQMLL